MLLLTFSSGESSDRYGIRSRVTRVELLPRQMLLSPTKFVFQNNR
jgi:hypothetical protein